MTRKLHCVLLHPEFEQMKISLELDGKDVEYPDICYRCDPDRYMSEWQRCEEQYQLQKIESLFTDAGGL